MNKLRMIIQFLKDNPLAETYDIAEALDLDLEELEDTLEKMTDKHLIEEVNDGQYVVLNQNDFGVIE